MRPYEIIFILDPGVSEEAVEGEIGRVRDLVGREGGEIVEVQKWGKKRLAYVIRKRREGYYVLLRVQCEPKAIPEVERHFKISDLVLKYLSVRVEEPRRPAKVKPAEPAPAMAEEGS